RGEGRLAGGAGRGTGGRLGPPRTALRPALPAHGPDLLPLPPDASPPRRAVGGGFVAPAVAERRRIPDARDGRAPRPGGRLLRGGLATLGRAPTEQPRAARPEREQRAPRDRPRHGCCGSPPAPRGAACESLTGEEERPPQNGTHAPPHVDGEARGEPGPRAEPAAQCRREPGGGVLDPSADRRRDGGGASRPDAPGVLAVAARPPYRCPHRPPPAP